MNVSSITLFFSLCAIFTTAKKLPSQQNENNQGNKDVGAIVHEVDMPEEIQHFIVETMDYGNNVYSGNVLDVAAYIHTQVSKKYTEYIWFVSANYEAIQYPYYHKMVLSPLKYEDVYLVVGLLKEC